jgi:hypothetical protein
MGLDQGDWSPDGKILYFRNAAQTLMRVAVDTSDGFRSGTPEPVSASLGPISRVNAARGGRLLVLRPNPDQPVPPIRIVVDWPALLRK